MKSTTFSPCISKGRVSQHQVRQHTRDAYVLRADLQRLQHLLTQHDWVKFLAPLVELQGGLQPPWANQ